MAANKFPKRTAVLLTLAMFVLGSCGGSDDSSSPPSETTPVQTDGEEVTPEATTDDDSTTPEAPSAGDGGAIVTIDGDSHEFSAEEVFVCFINADGIFNASLASSDFTQNLEVSLPPEGFATDDVLRVADEYASVDLTVSESEVWSADAYESDPRSVNNRNIPEGQTQVDTYQFDSAGASGTATFLNMEALTIVDGNSTGQPVSGSFEVSCG